MAQPTSATLRALAVRDERKYGLGDWFLRQIGRESGFDPNARSSAGALGIAQFIPSTARAYGLTNPFDPVAALDAAARYDRDLLNRFGSVPRALSAYNSGKPDAYKDPNFAGGQTFNYVKSILGSAGADASSSPAPAAAGVPTDRHALAMQLLDASKSNDYLGFFKAARNQNPTAAAGEQQQQQQTLEPGGLAGGFLPAGVTYKPGRLDQGHDFQTDPGAPILAPGDGRVVAVLSDPHGFGPAYPVVHFTTGPYAGKTLYVGHTIATVRPGQQFRAGQTLSRTGTTPIGNASVPGWAEIGYAPGGTPGGFGQKAPF